MLQYLMTKNLSNVIDEIITRKIKAAGQHVPLLINYSLATKLEKNLKKL